MTFDFFNTSDLAFGGKLTSAFKQLFNKTEQAEDNIDSVLERQAIYSDYFFKNYIVGGPTNATQPCRTNEILNLIKNVNDAIDVNILFAAANSTDDDILTINANVYDKTLNIVSKITVSKNLGIEDWGFTGTVAQKIGIMLSYYLFFIPADNNMSMITKCRLSRTKEPEEGEELLFKINIYPSLTYSKFTLSYLNKRYSMAVGNFSGYKKLGTASINSTSGLSTTYNYDKYFTDTIVNTGGYPSKKYMEKGTSLRDFILSVKVTNYLVIKVNGVIRYNVKAPNATINTIIFIILRKGDVIEFEKDNDLGMFGKVKGLDTDRFSLVSYEEEVKN